MPGVTEGPWPGGRVGEVLEMAYAQHQSGILHIERAQGRPVETGDVYLFSGQPVSAYAEGRSGEEALAYLLTWRNIHASFVSDVPAPLTQMSPGEKTQALSVSLSTLSTLLPPLPAPIKAELPARTEWLVPQRIKLERPATSWPLTYHQRWIYFLIDEQRTIGDLSRCTGKTVTEVMWILRALQDQCLVFVKGN